MKMHGHCLVMEIQDFHTSRESDEIEVLSLSTNSKHSKQAIRIHIEDDDPMLLIYKGKVVRNRHQLFKELQDSGTRWIDVTFYGAEIFPDEADSNEELRLPFQTNSFIAKAAAIEIKPADEGQIAYIKRNLI